ncbi:FKBP-type peptidyl-prolyl cis-trans isomerase [Salinibacterium sp. M195]|nr:FKBP-type peptidyl-prolyl cis-trans isomerase [Salinibacterium sp. M195]
MRKLAVVALSAGVVVSLTGCANGQFDLAACSPVFSEGSNSALVSADGMINSDPEARFPTPLVANDVESHIVSVGDGQQVNKDDVASLQITIYNGETGEQLISSGHDNPGLLVSVVDREPHFGEIAQCSTVGSRIATVGTAGDILGAESIAQYQLPLAEDDTIVMVSDVELRYPGRATGANRVPLAGLPAVVLAPNGQPGFTFPGSEAPSELAFSALKVGSGDALASGDLAVMHISGVEWDAADTFRDTWDGTGVPIPVLIESNETTDGGLPVGLAEALIGQTVGSQILVVLPPDVGFPEGSEPEGVTPGKTLVFVFDILGIQEQ